MKTALSHGGLSTCQMGFGPNLMDVHSWRNGDSDLDFVQDTSAPGHFAQQWKLRQVAQDASSKEIDYSKSRHLTASRATLQPFKCADVKVGKDVIFHELTGGEKCQGGLVRGRSWIRVRRGLPGSFGATRDARLVIASGNVRRGRTSLVRNGAPQEAAAGKEMSGLLCLAER